MTEKLKQKAEESAKQNCPIPMNWNEIDVAERAGYVKGYIASAIENGIQWHDLRKDPNDLPPKMGLGSKEVYVQYDTKGVTDFACYRFDKNIWERSEDDEQAVGVIAWCEIPQFKE